MIKEQRHKRILSILRQHEVVAVQDLSAMLPDVSSVTIRRDIAELGNVGALRRTRGGAMLPSRPSAGDATDEAGATPLRRVDEAFDAIILPPIEGRGADALRREVRRRKLPFLAESAPQDGGIYLGPDNRAAGRDLGLVAGDQVADELKSAHILIISQDALPNTRERAEGFEEGFRTAFKGTITTVRVNGQGSYKPSLRAAGDALQSHGELNVVFGVNDHSALAGCDAAARSGRKVRAFAIGGERAEFVAGVADSGPLSAVAALFPEVVGDRAIDWLAVALSGGALAENATTPHAVITADNLSQSFEHAVDGWRLKDDVRRRLVGRDSNRVSTKLAGSVGFMPHYPAHDWYRVMIQSMEARAEAYGLRLVVATPHQGISSELARLRRLIAALAVERIGAGETIIIGEGQIGVYLADEIRRLGMADNDQVRGLTVITNALDVLERLSGTPAVKAILTSGEYQVADRCLVGPSLDALFDRINADKAFLSVGGISDRFGISAVDERLALAGTRFVRAARQVIAMADHTLIAFAAHHRIAHITDVDELITDDGSPPADRLALRLAGVELLVTAGDVAAEPNAADHDTTAPDTQKRKSTGRKP